MNVATADGHKERFIKLLHELFQLDKPELDFGLYRIMHAKSDQLSRFIREDLSQTIDEAFAEQGEQQLAAMRQEIEEKRRQAEELGAPDPDSAPAVKQARAAYDVAKREQSASSDIYDHLYRFFSRYYDKGDFMSRRHHVAENDSRAAPYAVPYDGREVYLHWANKDQYYVKSSETLSNFTFNLNEALEKLQGTAAQAGLGFDSVDAALRVHCRVVDATEGEHNDVKESTERFFIIHHDEPARLDGADLVLQFEYRPDPEKTGQSGTWQRKRLEEAEEFIMEALRATDGVAAYRDGLATPAPTEKQKSRTLLGKYLLQYTARNTMDYFIHKDLGGFLSRELDFYIKNEILRLDDIDNADVLIVEKQLKKIQTLRKIAKQIITFLAQLEDFQKKLWLKRKFVTEVEYCITLERIKDSPGLLKAVFLCEPQRKEWERLYSLDLDALDNELEKFSAKDMLKKNRYKFLMLDTKNFSRDLKWEIVFSAKAFGDEIGGVAFNSDNSSAMRFFSKYLESSVDCIYIDPPYNTGGGDFLYKDGYEHSSWLSAVSSKLSSSKLLMKPSGVIFSSIDDNEVDRLRLIFSDCFGESNRIADIVWQKRYSPDSRTTISDAHEYILAYGKNARNFSEIRRKLPLGEVQTKQFSNPDDDERGPWKADNFTAQGYRPNQMYPIKTPSGEVYTPPAGRCWIAVEEKFNGLLRDRRIYFGKHGDGRPALKRFLKDMDGMVPWTWWPHTEVGHSQSGMKQGMSYFGRDGGFVTQKPIELISRILRIATHHSDKVLDFYAGSGTTADAVIRLNDDEGANRKYYLVESGGHFNHTLKSRIKKVVYAKKWKDGSPVDNGDGEFDGSSHCFKYIQLESYDDTLNNLELDDNPQRDALMEKNPELRHDYTLKYLLDVETRGSASLLNTEWFRDPESYTLKVKQPGSDETRKTAVDLVETFNWLIGLHVTHLDKPRTYVARFEREEDPELPEDQNTRLRAASLRENEDGAYWIRQVEGHVRRIPGSDEDLAKVLVVWRKLTDDPEKDAAVLEALLEKYKIGTTDSEFDAIYINGPHGLSLTGSARSRVHSLEETFHARMWEGCDDEH